MAKEIRMEGQNIEHELRKIRDFGKKLSPYN